MPGSVPVPDLGMVRPSRKPLRGQGGAGDSATMRKSIHDAAIAAC